MSLIKDIYSPLFYDKFADTVQHVIPTFNKQQFIAQIFDEDFKHKEWKERMKHTTRVFHDFLPTEFAAAAKLIEKIIVRLRSNNIGEDSLAYIFFPDYIETYGLDDLDNAIIAFEFITQFVSCEFAVRPFILKYEDKMITQMIKWSKHENHKVRRLASEGSRPRLPWAMAIPALKKDPSPILPLLENLKNDPSEWVRRSVANNLNDIAKGQPEIIIAIALKWKNISKETDAIIKHGSRTLLKQGHPEILQHYELESKDIRLNDLKILSPEVKIGESLEFSFTITNNSAAEQKIRLEYGIFYKRQNGQLSKKVFKISEKSYLPDQAITIHRKQKFILITTRKFYAGAHKLSIILNGEEKGIADFELLDQTYE